MQQHSFYTCIVNLSLGHSPMLEPVMFYVFEENIPQPSRTQQRSFYMIIRQVKKASNKRNREFKTYYIDTIVEANVRYAFSLLVIFDSLPEICTFHEAAGYHTPIEFC